MEDWSPNSNLLGTYIRPTEKSRRPSGNCTDIHLSIRFALMRDIKMNRYICTSTHIDRQIDTWIDRQIHGCMETQTDR